MSDQLYESMAKHPDAGQVMQLLELVEPVDEFSRALCLVRDCFSPSATLRLLSRNKLKGMLKGRLDLMNAYQQAVVAAVPGAKTFTEALAKGDRQRIEELRDSYERQANALMARPLEEKSE